jgi:hypothetical protein
MKKLLTLSAALVVLLFATTGWADDVVDTDPWQALLSEYVDSKGQVDYATWHADKEDRKKLDTFLAKIAKAEPDANSKKAQLAFYINAYNATVVDSVLEKWPVKSVMKEKGFFKKEKHPIAGKKITLDALEHKLIRPTFQEPRIHFVLVCAAKSCPRLRAKAVTEKNLEATLDAAAKEFIPAATTTTKKSVTTSQLFNWFEEDFENETGSVQGYLAKYTDGKTKKALKSGDAKLKFSEYDWAINKQ